jgi:O-antigen ligase
VTARSAPEVVRPSRSGGQCLVAPPQAGQRLGWDGIGAIAVLFLAALNARDWVAVPSAGFLFFRVLWVLAYVGAAARLVQLFGTEGLIWTLRHQPALCALLAMAVASGLWSLAPAVSVHKATSLLGTTVLGVFIGFTCPAQRLISVLHWLFALVIICSIAAALLLPAPELGPGEPFGWRGIVVHKNSFGALAALAAMFFLIMTLWQRIQPLWGAALCASCLVALAWSRSRTSMFALGASLIACAYVALAQLRQHPTRLPMQRAALGLVLGVALVPWLVAPLGAALGVDPLNGRMTLWNGALQILRERPVTGYGYEVVWGQSTATLLPHVEATALRSSSSAHNSIVNVATELGIPAAIVACAYLFGSFATAVRLFEQQRSAFSLFALVFLVAFTVLGFAETHLLQVHSVFWILFVALTVAVQRSLAEPVSDAAVMNARA